MDSMSSPESSPPSSELSSPSSRSPPSSPVQAINPAQRSRTLFDAERSGKETQSKERGFDYACLFGSYAWDPRVASTATAGEQYGLTLLAGCSPTEGSWEIHQESLISSPLSSFGFAPAQMKQKRLGLGGTFRFLPITTEDERRNVFWMELTKTKEIVQEQGALPTETITTPCVQRVPYQINRTANKVGVLINAFGKEQILLVKGV